MTAAQYRVQMYHDLFHPSTDIRNFFMLLKFSLSISTSVILFCNIWGRTQCLIHNSESNRLWKFKDFSLIHVAVKADLNWCELSLVLFTNMNVFAYIPNLAGSIIYSICTVLSSTIYKPLKSEIQLASKVLDKGLWTCISKNIMDWSNLNYNTHCKITKKL